MKTKLTQGTSGAALVATLMLIAVMSLMLISYLLTMQMDLVSSNSYAGSVRAQEIGMGGIQEVISDLRAEMDAGSDSDAVYEQNGLRILMPNTAIAAQPFKNSFAWSDYGMSSSSLPPSLIRVSRAESRANWQPFPATYDSSMVSSHQASAVSSTLPASNGRFISAKRWNAPLLLGITAPTSFESAPPDWVYVTRAGRKVLSDAEVASGDLLTDAIGTKTKAVLGRYAFAVYDEGALLDANIAGYLSTVAMPQVFKSPGVSQSVGGKSFLSYADLSQLPGLAGRQPAIDKFVTWRNKGGLASPTTNYLQAVANYASHGFSKLEAGDNPILGRQDLIDFFEKLKTDGEIVDLSSLQFLGTFSRGLSAPTARPSLNSAAFANYKGGLGSAAVAYKDNAEADMIGTVPNPNRNLANLRSDSAVPRTHYKDDGTTETDTIEAGDQLVQRRFSLAKLAWLTFKGPSALLSSTDPVYHPGGTEAAIQACFGLIWVSGSGVNEAPYWEYVGPTGTTPQHPIKTLGEVADESPKREPNFFELLKAGILSGSLGRDPGDLSPAADGSSVWNAPKTYEGPGGSDFVNYSSNKDRHLIQIAANIIDQADLDSYPTAIHFKEGFSETSYARKIANTLFGLENLPVLNRLCPIDAEYPKGTLNLWLRPEIWNPNQAAAASPSGLSPTRFRTRAYGRIQMQWWLTVGAGSPLVDPGTKVALPVDYDNGSTPSPEGLVYFSDTPGAAASAFYRKPTLLTKTHYDASATASTNVYAFGASSYPNYPEDNKAVNYSNPAPPPVARHFVGLYGGNVDAPPIDQPYQPRIPLTGNAIPPAVVIPAKKQWMNPGTSTADPNDCHLRFKFVPTGLSVGLECWDGTYWRPYSFMNRINMVRGYEHWNPPKPPIFFGTDYTGYTLLGGSGDSWLRSDPRTDRFSILGCRANAGFGPMPDPKLNTENSFEPNATTQFGTEAFFPWRSSGFTYIQPPNVVFPNPVPGLSAGYFPPNYWSGVPTTTWAVNDPNAVPIKSTSKPDLQKYNSYYVDPDGVVRPGDSLYRDQTTGNGCMLFHGDQLTTSLGARRPVILNRPFRSVGELGYVYRDLPFRSLDFFSQSSADSALLDLFSVCDQPKITNGVVNISNAPAPVLQALIAGTQRQEAIASAIPPVSLSSISTTEAKVWSETIVKSVAPTTSTPGAPLLNRSEIVNRLMNPTDGLISVLPTATPVDKGNKNYLETTVRALAPESDTRTWNLMIDIIAQAGRMAPKGTKLDNFIVEGERRYWLHVSIDRYTGKVIDQMLETVYE